MEAQLTVTGHVGGDVELRRTQQTGTPRTSFRLACTPRVYRQGGWSDDPTTWLTVICWRSLAEHVAASLSKGDPVVVVGRVRTQTWTDDDGDHERSVVEATTVGHDLSRGVATFHRIQRADTGLDSAARPGGATDEQSEEADSARGADEPQPQPQPVA